jgi:hypothetical protein
MEILRCAQNDNPRIVILSAAKNLPALLEKPVVSLYYN